MKNTKERQRLLRRWMSLRFGWLFRGINGWFGMKRTFRILQGYGDVGISISFYEDLRGWKKFLKEFKPKLEPRHFDSTEKNMWDRAEFSIDGIDITAYGPHEPNPNFDKEAADKKGKEACLRDLLFCGYKHKAVMIDKKKIKDISECSWEYKQIMGGDD